MTHISLGKFIGNPNGKPRVNLECGPAQPSLLNDICLNPSQQYIIHADKEMTETDARNSISDWQSSSRVVMVERHF